MQFSELANKTLGQYLYSVTVTTRACIVHAMLKNCNIFWNTLKVQFSLCLKVKQDLSRFIPS